eukprot:scaffold81831_cov46-Attheya_sp.AAC.5
MALATFFSLAVSMSTAAVSQACQNESDALTVDSTIMPLINDILASVNQEMASCIANVCNVEFNNLTADLKLACVAAGGQIFISDSTQICSDITGSITINFNNQALCVGLSCDKDNVEEVNDLAFDMLDDVNEKALGFGSTCRSDTEIEGSSVGERSDTEIEGSSGGVPDPGSSSSTTATGTALLVASAVFLVFLV